MYVKETSDTERSLAVELVLEDIPGGGVVDPDDFKAATTSVGEGALLGVDSSGIYHIFKTAELYEDEADDETGYKVLKGHEFKVGDFITDSGLAGAAYAITEITTTETDYDTITVGTTLGHAMLDGECLVQATAQAAAGSAAFKYTPVGISRNSVDLANDNLGCGIMVRGRVRESLLPYSVDANIKALSALSLIRFV